MKKVRIGATGLVKVKENKSVDYSLTWNSMSDTHREVILGLTTVGMIQLHILEPPGTNTSDSLHCLLENKSALENAYLEVASILREKRSNFPSAHDVHSRNFSKKLERIVNVVKVIVTGSKEVANRFGVSNYKYLIQQVEKVLLCCPWSDSSSSSEWSFIHEFSTIELIGKEKNFRHLLITDLEKTLGPLSQLMLLLSSESTSHSVQNCVPILHDTDMQVGGSCDVTTKILATYLVMGAILDGLDVESLLRSRLVSRQFNRYVIIKTKKKCSSILTHFRYDNSSKTYLSVNGLHRSISEFTLFLTSRAAELPFSTFSFTKGNLASEDLNEFFEIHGNRIRELRIQLQYYPHNALYRPYTFSPKVFRKILTTVCNSVEKLVLEYLPEYWCVRNLDERRATNIPPLFPLNSQFENMKLMNLKSLEINFIRDKTLHELLVAGCNLETCSSFQTIIPFLQLNKFHLLRQLWWGVATTLADVEYFRSCSSSVLEKNIIGTKSSLIDFGVYANWFLNPLDSVRIMTNVLNMILQSCRQTLEIFRVFTPLSNFPGLKLPCLQKVKTLSLATRPHFHTNHYSRISTNRFFPLGTCLSSVFPHVQRICLGFTHYESEALPSWTDAFGPAAENKDEMLKTVKYIEVVENLELPVGWMGRLSILCPNVESIWINTIFYDFQDTMNGLWTFGNAKDIKLNIDVRVAERTPFIIDSAFTGLPISTCHDLFNRLTRMEPESLQGLRVNSSILDVKALASLMVTFVDPNLEGVTSSRSILTKVAQLYAFDLCPQLNICLKAAGRTEARSADLLNHLTDTTVSAHLHCPEVTEKGWSTPFSFRHHY